MNQLQLAMLVWSVGALLIVVVTIISMVLHKYRGGYPNSSSGHLFDFSSGREHMIASQQIVRAALDESSSDDQFETQYKHHWRAHSNGDAEMAWAWLERQVAEYRLGDELTASTRIMAARYLADVAKRYNLDQEPR